jgi:hypothetical protein
MCKKEIILRDLISNSFLSVRQHNHSEGKSGGKHGNSGRTEKARRLASEAAEDDVTVYVFCL